MTSVERPDTTRQRAVEAGSQFVWSGYQNEVASQVVDAAVPVVLDDIEAALRELMTKPPYPLGHEMHAAWRLGVDDALARVQFERERNGWSRD